MQSAILFSFDCTAYLAQHDRLHFEAHCAADVEQAAERDDLNHAVAEIDRDSCLLELSVVGSLLQ